MLYKRILLTGRPGIGKTTVLRRLSLRLSDFRPAGFYTEEIREWGRRIGFVIKRLDGSTGGILARVDIKSKYRVGRYGVDMEGFERFLSEIEKELYSSRLVLIDEIGKMECFSERFIKIIENILKTDKVFIATIAEKGTGFIEDIKKRQDILILEITEHNRDGIISEIERKILWP